MMRVLAAVAALTLVGCQSQVESASSAGSVETAVASGTPGGFVRILYEGDYDLEPAGGLWSARVDALIAESRTLTGEGEVGIFEADPICDCQDGAAVLRDVRTTSTGPDSANVSVVQGFSDIPGVIHHKTYNLVREGGVWRIDDMHYQNMNSEFAVPPFRRRLNAWIADAKSGQAQG